MTKRGAIGASVSWGLALMVFLPAARAVDVPTPSYPSPAPLLVRSLANGSGSVRYSSGAAFAEITKGTGVDPATITGEFYFMRGPDGAVASFAMPAGSFDGTSGWRRNDATKALYYNKAAPSGATQVAAALIRRGKVLRLKAKGLGDVPFDIDANAASTAYTSFCVENGGEPVCHCSELRDCEETTTSKGTTLKCRSGVSDETCRAVTRAKPAFSAQTSVSFDECCPENIDDLQDVIEFMNDSGYGVTRGEFAAPREAGAPPGEQFAATGSLGPDGSLLYPGSHDSVAHFDEVLSGDDTLVRLGGQDAVVTRLVSNSTNAIWSWDVSIGGIVQDVGGPVLLRGASTGGSANQATMPLGPELQGQKVNVVWSGDQNTIEDVAAAFAFAGNTDPILVVPIPDVQIPDGAGGTGSAFSASDLDVPRGLFSFRRRWNLKPGRVAEDIDSLVGPVDLGNGNHAGESAPLYVFRKDQKAPLTPVAAPSTFSPPHADLVSKTTSDFDRLVQLVIRYFDEQLHLTFVSDQPLLAKNGVESHLGVPADIFEGGARCIADGLYCGLDDPLSHYAWPGDSIVLEPDDFYLVLGLNYGRLVGLGGPMAEVSLVGVYNVEDPDDSTKHFTPIAEIGITNDEEDDANQGILPLDNFLTGKFSRRARALFPNTFIVEIARPENCYDTLAGICLDTNTMAQGEPIVIAGRLQLNPVTGTKPDDAQIVPWRLLHFKETP
jgi:hypothetical protein